MPPWEGTARDLRGLSSTAGHAVTLRGVASAEEWYVTAPTHRPLPVVAESADGVPHRSQGPQDDANDHQVIPTVSRMERPATRRMTRRQS